MRPRSSAKITLATGTSSCLQVRGFDEFYGNLYHLNAEEEPELPDYPKDASFHQKFGPRGVLDCKASDKDDTTDVTDFMSSFKEYPQRQKAESHNLEEVMRRLQEGQGSR